MPGGHGFLRAACLPVPPPGYTFRLLVSKAEGEGVEPSRLIARPGSSRVPSPFGLPFHIKSGRLDSNQRSRASEARDHSRLVHVPISVGQEALESSSPAFQASASPSQ